MIAALSLVIAGMPTSALANKGASPSSAAVPSASTPGTISGQIVLPPGIDGENFDVDTYYFDSDPSSMRWRLGEYVSANPDGSFVIGDLEDGREYRLHLDNYADGYVGGFYAG